MTAVRYRSVLAEMGCNIALDGNSGIGIMGKHYPQATLRLKVLKPLIIAHLTGCDVVAFDAAGKVVRGVSPHAVIPRNVQVMRASKNDAEWTTISHTRGNASPRSLQRRWCGHE